MYILFAILVFGILIAVHELGHFLVAKACGVRVDEFAIGMGPAIWKKQKGRRSTPSAACRSAAFAPWRARMRRSTIRARSRASRRGSGF